MVTKYRQSADSSVWSPDTEPEEDIGDGDLGDLDLGTLHIVFTRRSEAVHIHLLGLGFQSGLVGNNSLDDGVVKSTDEKQGEEVIENVGKEDKCPLIDPGREEVIGAGDQESLGHVLPPPNEGGGAAEHRVEPDAGQDSKCHSS